MCTKTRALKSLPLLSTLGTSSYDPEVILMLNFHSHLEHSHETPGSSPFFEGSVPSLLLVFFHNCIFKTVLHLKISFEISKKK